MKKAIVLITLILTTIVGCKQNPKQEVKQGSEDMKTAVIEAPKEVEKLKISPNIKVSKVSFRCYPPRSRAAQVRGASLIFYCTIKNESDIGIKRIFMDGTFKYKGRTLSHTDRINYSFRKGLEPGEEKKLTLIPNALSSWNDKIKPGDQGVFSLKVISVEDYNGEKRQ